MKYISDYSGRFVLRFLLSLCLTHGLMAQKMTPPECYGGMREFRHFFEQAVVYPESSLANDEKGQVVLFFIVNADGTTRNLKIWQSAGKALDDEAIRLFRMLLWIPATYDDQNKASEHLLTFHFSPRKYRAICKRRGFDVPPSPIQPAASSLQVYTTKETDQLPQGTPPRPFKSLQNYVAANLEHPHAAKVHGLHGSVELWFVVEPNGQISNVRIIRSIGGGCNEEALRLLRRIQWQAGTKDGKAVRSEMILTIYFPDPNKHTVNNIPTSGGSIR
ncbi:MAG: energy transducer TonB [Salibacteraceae bacterium]